MISATARSGVPVGEYKVIMTSPGGSTCVAYLTLRSKPCKQVAHTYNCGTTPATPVGSLNDPLLTNLAPGDTIRTGDFDVVVMTVSGGSGGWTGTGYTEIPYLKNTRVAVELKGAVVNDCYELVGGTIVSAYDPNWWDEVKNVTLTSEVPLQTQIKDILSTFKPEDISKLNVLTDSLNTLITSYRSDTAISIEAREAIVNNLTVIQGELTSFINCSKPVSTSAGRVASGACATPQVLIDLINQGIPEPTIVKQNKIIEFGTFQWEEDADDIADQIHSQANRAFIENRITSGGGSLKYWNEYISLTLERTRDIYENGKNRDALLGVRDVLSPDSEERIINNFYTGRQPEVAFEIGSPISNKLIEYYNDTFTHPYIERFIKRVLPTIKEGKFNEITGDFVFNNRRGATGIGLPDFSHIIEIPFYDFYGIMGGTQKIKVEMELKTISQKSQNLINPNLLPFEYKTLKLSAIFHIIDWYGADEDDIDGTSTVKSLSESLKALFMLQHYWGIGHPFQTRFTAKLINDYIIK